MTAEVQPAKGRGRLQLVALAVVFLGPLLAAIVMYTTGIGGLTGDSRVNYGTLLDPPVSLDARLHFDSGTRGRWTLMVLAPQCGDSCLAALTDLRQIRLATGREIERIERLLVSDQAPAPAVLTEHPGLRVSTPQSAVGAQLASALAPLATEHIYIMDPVGNVILRYSLAPERKPFLKDLRKLLKLSRIG